MKAAAEVSKSKIKRSNSRDNGVQSSASASKFFRGSSVDEQLFKRKKRSKNNQDLWSVKHTPQSASDLAVHPRKIQDVRTWLKSAISSARSPKVLLLSGPTGSGKTATLWVLAKELELEVQEWHNPATVYDEGLPYEPQPEAFKRFVRSAIRYKPLNCEKKLVLIEELPAFLSRDASLLHETIDQFRTSCPWPLVVIHSGDTVRKLFPQEVVGRISQIVFNPIAQTNLVKALSAIAMIESSYGVTGFRIPDKPTLTSLSVSGDIRAAINALQFGCLNSKSFDTKRTKNTNARDANLDLFHAMGKVLYCKRHPNDEKGLIGGKHLSKSRKSLQFDPQEVLDKSPMSTESFVCFLHQNYLDFFSDIQQVSDAIDYLSVSDLFFTEWTVSCCFLFRMR